MGLLDEAIRQHLELKRRHGADEDEVARQEAEALGPVSVEELEVEASLDSLGEPRGADDVEPASPDVPFDRAAEAGLTGERDTPSFEWHGSSDEIEVPSFVPAEPEPSPPPRSEPPADLEPPVNPEPPADLEPPADAELRAEEGGAPITDMPTELFEPLDVDEGESGGIGPPESEALGSGGALREDEARIREEDPSPSPPSPDVEPLTGEPAFGAEDEVNLASGPSEAGLAAEVEPPLAESAALEPGTTVEEHEPLAERGAMIEGEQAPIEPEDFGPAEEASVESLELSARDEPSVEPVEPASAQRPDERPEEEPAIGEWPAPGPAFARSPVDEDPSAGDLSQGEPVPIEAPFGDGSFSEPLVESGAPPTNPEPVEHAPVVEPPVEGLEPAEALGRDDVIEEPLEETGLYEVPPAGENLPTYEPLAEDEVADAPFAETPPMDEEGLNVSAPSVSEGPPRGAPGTELEGESWLEAVPTEGPLAEQLPEERPDLGGAALSGEEPAPAESRDPDVPDAPEDAHRALGGASERRDDERAPDWGVVDQPTAFFTVEEELAAGATGDAEPSAGEPLESDPLHAESEPLAAEAEPRGPTEWEDQGLEAPLYLEEEREAPGDTLDEDSAHPESRSARGFFEDTDEHEGVRRTEGLRRDPDFDD